MFPGGLGRQRSSVRDAALRCFLAERQRTVTLQPDDTPRKTAVGVCALWTSHSHQRSMQPSNSASQYIRDGWFSEVEALWPGQKFSLAVEEVLLNVKTDFQDVIVFKSSTYGKVLILDGVIQLTERDEFAYQEMIVHIPLFAAKNPKKVLIVGGGDGGVLREVVKHQCVETIHMCEIDRHVVEIAKEHFAEKVATAFNDPRLQLFFEDAAKFIVDQGSSAGYDCVIVDSSDPVGPAQSLFQMQFFQSIRNSLNPAGGILCTQGECQWLHLELIQNLVKSCRDIFPVVKYAYTTIPTYPSGQIGFLVCSTFPSDDANGHADPSVPTREVSGDMKSSLRYYSSALHSAAFTLPAFTHNALYGDS